MNDRNIDALIHATRPVRIAATVALGALALFLLIIALQAAWYFNDTGKPENTITVTGEGKVENPPNLARVTFTVQQSASTVAAAQSAATAQTNQALAALKVLDIADADVQTSGYQVYPQYESQACPPGALCPQTVSNKIVGYNVSQTVTVKVRDTGKVGDVLGKLGTLGVQNVSGPDFALDDNGAAHDQARGLAIKDAQQKAKVLAQQLGVGLGTVQNFSESGNGPIPMATYSVARGAATAASAPPTIPAGTNETDVTVTITYAIR